MNLNKIGKYILGIDIVVFVFLIASLFLPFDIFENMSQSFGAPILIFSFVSFCFSFALIFYNATLPKRKKATKIISIFSGSLFTIGWFFKFMHWPGASVGIIV